MSYVFYFILFICNLKIISLDDPINNVVANRDLTNIIIFSSCNTLDPVSYYVTITTTPKGNLICSASVEGYTDKSYYGLKSNGRPYFIKDNKETEFSNTDSDKMRKNGHIYGIQLSSTSSDDKEYIISFANDDSNFELYDFVDNDNAIVYYKEGTSFFGSLSNNFKYGTVFKLENVENDNIYIIGVTVQVDGGNNKFKIFKLCFNNVDIVNNNPIVASYIYDNDDSGDSEINSVENVQTSCFETDGENYIICFVLDEDLFSLHLVAFDYELDKKNEYQIVLETEFDINNYIYKCIHFTGVAGVFLYIDDNYITIKFKKYSDSGFQNYFNNIEKIVFENPNSFDMNPGRADLIKLEDRKFCYATTEGEQIFHLLIFNNYEDEQIIIRHYSININEYYELILRNEVAISLYNGYFVLASDTYFIGRGGEMQYNLSSYLLIFSYPNSTDFNIDITNDLKSGINPIINFNQKCKIENNIFGYEPVGIKLTDFSNGLKLLNEDDKSIIQKDSIFTKNVELIINEDTYNSNYRIEYAMVVRDAPYSLFKDYSEVMTYYSYDEDDNDEEKTCEEDEETYYEQKDHVGRISYCDITIDLNSLSLNTCSIDKILNNICSNGEVMFNQIGEIKSNLLSDNYKGKNIIITTKSLLIQLSPLTDQTEQHNINPNISNIDLGDCEKELKSANSLPDDEKLIIFKMDIKTSDLSSTYVSFEVYDSSLNKLNLDVCNEIQITILSPANINDDSFNNLVQSLNESGYNIFDENDSFYNDFCATYTTLNGTDIILPDRRKDIFSLTLNYSFCQKDCKLKSYDFNTRKATCICNAISSFDLKSLDVDKLFNKKEIAKSFYDTLRNSNFQVLKCIHLVFAFSNILKNYGELFMTVLIILFIITMVIYFILGTLKLHQFLDNILKKNNNNNLNDNNNITDDKKENNIEEINIESINSEEKSQSNDGKNINSNFAPPKRKKIVQSKNNNVNNDINIIKMDSEISNIMSVNNNINVKKHIKEDKNEKRGISNEEKKEENMMNKELGIAKNNYNTEDNIEKDILEKKSKNLNDFELNELTYEEAIIYDKRTYFQFYWSTLKQNQFIIFTFLPMDDYNIIYAKIGLFIISFGLFFTINGFFFTDETMNKIYKDNGYFDFIFQIPQILFSSIVSSIADIILKKLSLSQDTFLDLKKEISEKKSNAIQIQKNINKMENKMKIKLIIFFVISLILMIFFWYFISCFCAVYKNTQVILITDTLVSFGTSMIYPFILSLIPGLLRIPALRAINKDLNCLYKLSLLLNMIL